MPQPLRDMAMKQDVLLIDKAVDILPESDGSIRFLTPSGGFVMRDPFGLVKEVTDKCRSGATCEDIAGVCNSQSKRDAAAVLIETLKQRRILTTQKTSSKDPLSDWIRHFAAGSELALPSLEVVGSGNLASLMKAKLDALGFDISPHVTDGSCLLAVSEQADMSWLRHKNGEAFRQHRPFMPVWIERSTVFWGPMTLPGSTGCLECHWHRQQAAARSAFPRNECQGEMSTSAVVSELAAVLACGELLRWGLQAYVDTEIGMAWHFDLLSLEFCGNKVLRLPRCHICGAPS